MKNKENAPTEQELHASVETCFYAANQCVTFHIWARDIQPVIQSVRALSERKYHRYMRNGIIEATIMFFRKTNEFFKLYDEGDKPDNLHAYQWKGFPHCGAVFTPSQVLEMHKRIGHLTVREVRCGPMEWQPHVMVQLAVQRWITFFVFLAEVYYAADAEMATYCVAAHRSLTSISLRIETDLEAMYRAGHTQR
jgi:hypothetical protein